MGENYGSIDTDDSTYHRYYIINFSSSPYTLQYNLIIDGRIIFSGEMVNEGTYFFQSLSILNIMIKKINNTIVSLQKIINGDIRVIHYDSKGDVTSYLRSISQKYTCTLSPLNAPME